MTNNSDLQQAVWQEFRSQYPADELPPEWQESFLEELPEMARRSALRLRHNVKDSRVEDLIELLETASEHPEHPLIQTICEATLIDWPEETHDWNVLQKLLKLIAVNLRQASAPA